MHISGSSTSRLSEENTSKSLACIVTTADPSSLLISILTTIRSFDGNSLSSKRRDLSSSGNGHQFTPLKISRCAQITIELKDKE